MKKYSIVVLMLISIATHSQLKIPKLSSTAKIIQHVGLTQVEIDYSRPSIKGRTIFGESGLLAFGKAWRTGANNATKITLSESVEIKGNVLDKGSYTLLSFPNRDTSWEIKWYSYTSSNWTTYIDQKPLFIVKVPVIKRTNPLETLEISFQDITLSSAKMVIEWERIKLEIPLKVQEQEKITKLINRELSGPSKSDYFQAALYFHETGVDLVKALKFIQKVTKSEKALFFQVTREAMILSDLNRGEEAVKVAKRGLILAKKVGNNDFIWQNEKIIKKFQ